MLAVKNQKFFRSKMVFKYVSHDKDAYLLTPKIVIRCKTRSSVGVEPSSTVVSVLGGISNK